jgi:acyl-CoA reductase-like NAD-dependent aldehyde dehydrogenase
MRTLRAFMQICPEQGLLLRRGQLTTTITKLPAGVVTIIYPFNWPLAILAASLPYALMAGNAVIVKPPPTTPLSSVLTLRHLVRALPPCAPPGSSGTSGSSSRA